MKTLSILICHLPTNRPDRVQSLAELMGVLQPQVDAHKERVEIIINDAGPPMQTGTKRQRLLMASCGEYVVYIDDDDMVPTYYVEEMLKAIESGPCCVGIKGTMTTDGQHMTEWRLSKDYQNVDRVENGKTVYYRRTNHITAVKRDIAMRAGFPDKSNAEDKHYSDRLVLHTEVKIDRPMYEYRFSTKNKTYR